MKKKPSRIRQVRLPEELVWEIEAKMGWIGIRVSFPAFVESLIRKGLEASKEPQSTTDK